MTDLKPFILRPVLLERPWGGRRLEQYGKQLPEGLMIGESWEIADLPPEVVPSVADPQSRVASGRYAGASLADLVAELGDDLLGPVAPTGDGRFPLLFKLLDAHEHLSIQVHPHRDYVESHPEVRLKTESWYVIEASGSAVLYLDVADGVEREDVSDALGSSSIVPALRTVAAEPGGFHHVPAGLVHSLGAGVMVAEVQTPSDTTFRLYDWAVEYERAPRQLHLQEGLESLRIHPPEAYSYAPVADLGLRQLVSNEHYWMCEHRCESGTERLVSGGGPRVLNVVSGAVAVDDVVLEKGTTAVVPAASAADRFEVDGPATVLEIGFPGIEGVYAR